MQNILSKNVIFLIAVFLLSTFAAGLKGQNIPAPREHFGFSIGDNYKLATYSQTADYFSKLSASPRVKLIETGTTEEGRPQYALIISSPETIKDLERYRSISEKLARAEGIDGAEARKLATEGKAVVWIDGGLHATEVVGTHQLIETAWKLVSSNDPETVNILNNVIVLLVHANPDGQELVSSWYMREADTLKRKMNIPRLYQKYAGHDNNRDFYMTALRESKNMSRLMYLQWFPQIMYNHHQTGPAGTVLAGPPYRDPFNYVYDPLVITTIDALGAAMSSRLNTEQKPGYTMKSGSSYSTWYNGGLRTTTYYHNMVGLLTEIIGNPTPTEIPLVPDRLLPSGATPYPITPSKWYFRQSIDYSVSLNYAVLNYAARYREEVLFNIWRMGMNSIEKGAADTWTPTPSKIAEIRRKYEAERGGEPQGQQRQFAVSRIPLKYYSEVFSNPASRDPRAYIISPDQPDFTTAVKFINTLIRSGIRVHRATSAFTANNRTWPTGSFVVFTSQAFRPHVLDMFEPQDHPNDLQYPGGPPVPPYDAAGWTLAFQMGVGFERVLDPLSGAFEALPYGVEAALPSYAVSSETPAYLLSPSVNNNFLAVNSLLRSGIAVKRLKTGEFYVERNSKSLTLLKELAGKNGAVAVPLRTKNEAGQTTGIKPLRIGIWNRYGGSMESGWLSLVMEEFGYSYRFVYSQAIDSGNLRKKFDVLIFPSGAIPAYSEQSQGSGGEFRSQPQSDIPAEYQWMAGSLSSGKSINSIKEFLEAGGKVIALESSTNLSYHLGLPVSNALVKKETEGKTVQLRNTEYYIPGSLLTTELAQGITSNAGMPLKGDIYFAQNPVFRFGEGAEEAGLKPIAWFGSEKTLHSGWALGQEYLKDGIVSFYAPVGKGEYYAFGADIFFRSQTHGMFRQVFNILYGTK